MCFEFGQHDCVNINYIIMKLCNESNLQLFMIEIYVENILSRCNDSRQPKKIRMAPILKYDDVNYKIGERNPDRKQYTFGLLTTKISRLKFVIGQ